MANGLLDFAISYARKFHAVVPVGTWDYYDQNGELVDCWKRPVLKRWAEKPLRTEGQVRREWEKFKSWGRIPGPGLACGQICGGYIVIDFDRGHRDGVDGYETLLEWQQETGYTLPDTWTAITGGGGYHFYYRTDEAMRSWSNPDLGVDLRADGGFVVLPPSPHPSGKRYTWEIGPKDLADAAEADTAVLEFLRYCKPDGAEFRPSTHRGEGGERKMLIPPEIPEGGRTAALISLIGTMNRLGVDDDAILYAIRNENRMKCNPPLTEKELQTTVFPAVYRYEKGVPAETWKDKEEWELERNKPKSYQPKDHLQSYQP